MDQEKNILKKLCSEKMLNYLLLGITIIIVISPLIVKIPFVKNIFSWFLYDLGEMKSDYLAIYQGVIGTFLAITGALWTQRKIDQEKENQEVRKKAKGVLYNFERNLLILRDTFIAEGMKKIFTDSKVVLVENYDLKEVDFKSDTIFSIEDDSEIRPLLILENMNNRECTEIEEGTLSISKLKGKGVVSTLFIPYKKCAIYKGENWLIMP